MNLSPLYEKAYKTSLPLWCLFELTYQCNLGCVHCYLKEFLNHPRRELSTNLIKTILTDVKEVGCLGLILSGGEIFLRKDFFEIASFARKLNFALILLTNGTLITEEMADKIKPLYPEVYISLHGFEPSSRKITGVPNAFEKATNAIKLLKNRAVKVFASVVVSRINYKEIGRLYDFIRNELEVESLTVCGSPLIVRGVSGDAQPVHYRLTEGQFKTYQRVWFEQLGRFSKNRIKNAIMRKRKKNLCAAGRISFAISPYGEVNPCVLLKTKNENSLLKKSFREIWENNIDLLKIRSLRMNDCKDCRDCSKQNHCFFCPAVALQEKGDFTARTEEFCRLASIREEQNLRLQEAGCLHV